MGAFNFTLTSICYAYSFLHFTDVEFDHRGAVFFRAIFQLMVGLYTMQLTMIALFILKIRAQKVAHEIGQLLVMVLTMYITMQTHKYLRVKYKGVLQDEPDGISTATDQQAQVKLPLRIDLPKDEKGFSAQSVRRIRNVLAGCEQYILVDDHRTQLTREGNIRAIH